MAGGEAPEPRRPTSAPPRGPAPAGGLGRGIIQKMDKGPIQRVVAVGSGKGGVGKSSATALLACELRRRGAKVGILDADITGPSVPKLFGVRGPLADRGEGIEPAMSPTGIPIVSSQFLVEDERTPVIWRGPLVTRLIVQFYGGVNWGPLDYLLIDMPPGTSDVPLTVFQTIPIDGMIFVLTPQDLARLIVTKAMNMARDLHVPLIGLVENMAYLTCPHCRTTIDLFGPSQVGKVSEEYAVPILARLPLDPTLSVACDAGRVESVVLPEVTTYADELIRAIEALDRQRPKVL